MYIKPHRYYKAKALTRGSSDELALPETGVLSGIHLDFSMVNASAIHSYTKSRIIDHLTALKITDGATKTLFSLTGQCAKANHFFDNKRVLMEAAILYGSQTQRTEVLIPFGRVALDPYHGLDLGSWDQVKLVIENDAGANQCGTTGLSVDVSLLYMEDLPVVPSKYIKHYQFAAGKPSAAGQELNHDLPTTDLIQQLFCQLDPDLDSYFKPTSNPVSDSHNMKVYYRELKDLIWDHRPKDIFKINEYQYGQVRTAGRYYADATNYHDRCIGYVTNSPVGHCTSGTPAATDYLETEDSNDRYAKYAGVAGINYADEIAIGVGYYNCMAFFDAFLQPETEWLNPGKTAPGKGPIRLNWNGYTADHTLRTILAIANKQGEA